MPWTVAAVLGSAVIGGTAQSDASRRASHTQADMANMSSAQQMAMFNQIRQDLMPFIKGGTGAVNPLMDLLGYGKGGTEGIQAALEKMPGYQFAKQQGLNAVWNSFGAKGQGGLSGPELKGILEFGTGLADQTYGEQVNRLFNAANMGEGAASQSGQFGVATAHDVGQNTLFGANALGAGILGQANALTGATDSIGSMFLLNSLMKSQGGKGLFGTT